MYGAGFRFPGQTEFFAERCGVKNFAMCLTGGKLTVALVTSHIPLREVASALKQSEIVRVGSLLADFLSRRSSAQTDPANPERAALRVAVAGPDGILVDSLAIGGNPAILSARIGKTALDLLRRELPSRLK